jgi:hypothetical protein
MTGIRSWSSSSTAFGGHVMIVQLLTYSPSAISTHPMPDRTEDRLVAGVVKRAPKINRAHRLSTASVGRLFRARQNENPSEFASD